MAIVQIKNPRRELLPAPVLVLDDSFRGEVDVAATKISTAFTWSDTAEGVAFWASVCQRLRQIARDGILKGGD